MNPAISLAMLPIVNRQDLEHHWEFKRKEDRSDGLWWPVERVPSNVYTDLLANNLINDPWVDLNELSVRWVAVCGWMYKTEFDSTLSPAMLSATKTQVDMVFEGLDTFAEVFLNGKSILKSENMFMSYRINITKYLKTGEPNQLRIEFDSAVRRGEALVEEHKTEHNFIARQTVDSRIPVRKAQYHWGWDWGPILPGTSGPWRPVYLETYCVRIDDVWAQSFVSHDLQRCTGRLFARIIGANTQTDKVVLSLSFSGVVLFEEECNIEQDGMAQCHFEIVNPKLWYPRGYGQQNRHQIKAYLPREAKVADDDVQTFRPYIVLHEKSKLIGFRKAELIQEPDLFGHSFYFRINGIDVFCGGSCWIPGSSFLSQITAKQYREWIELLAEGNQTMVRVWGGGIYEDDAFYDACDDLGILVCQDFCFACGSYPVYPEFLASVDQEARQNIQRLRTHPSLVCWFGSNEDYQVQERFKLYYDYQDKDPKSWLKSSFPARYLYEYLLPTAVQDEDPGALYHPTSPWGDGRNTADTTVGDIHQWNIWHGDMRKYQEAHLLSGRFVSEFGMEAYPHMYTIDTVISNDKQKYPGSKSMDFHNKAIGHERRLLSYMTENYNINSTLDDDHDLLQFIHLSQMVQADTMEFAYKAWRRLWAVSGSRVCGGALVWQLNDCWPTISWAVVDHYMIKKPAFYSIARALKPLAIAVLRRSPDWTQSKVTDALDVGHVDLTLDSGEPTHFDVWIASSGTESVDVRVKIRYISIATGIDVEPAIIKDTVAHPNSTTDVLLDHKYPARRPDLRSPNRCWVADEEDPCVIYASLLVDGEVVSSDVAWPQPLKYIDFSNAAFHGEIDHNSRRIDLISARPLKGLVFEELPGLRFSDNNLDLVPGERKVVHYEGPAIQGLRWICVGARGFLMQPG
ncbi:glycoside hydrolase superfamily [Pseudomassariella vexata]|uniref:beta-mannosidase n=1 Tax=Pseudomassariella vexata TaxID=1141098 RepID=A0A1Y2DL93_9PEZI|nr:glycoside hydrolase superfamily [Pseudomassariella vexata]ORY60007.1 glycoside hydrolase superfamily [Pseudomassariella vexata]